MADETPAARNAAPSTSPDKDFVSEAVDKFVSTIDTIRSQTADKVVLVTATIVLIRVLVIATQELSFVDEHESWLAHLILGVLFSIGGAVLWRKRPTLEH